MTTIPVLALGFGTQELIIILCLALLFFGATKLPGIARSMGRSVNEFKAGMKDEPEPQQKKTPADSGAQQN